MKTGGAAFPLPAHIVHGLDDPTGEFPPGSGSAHLIRQPGMSLRDYFASAALQAIISRSVNDTTAAIPRLNNGFPIDRSAYADTAYQYADAMIQQREKS